MFCYNCGKQIDDKAVVCVGCGVSVKKINPTKESNNFSLMWNDYALFWLNFGVLNAKTTRREFWTAVLFNVLFFFASSFTIILVPFFLLAIFVPNICISVRRLHDIGKSGAWLLLFFIPIIGAVILIVWFCQPSKNIEENVLATDSLEN